MSERIFGTDGIRGRAFEGWLSEDNVSALGRAVGSAHRPHMRAGERPLAVLGHDGRASGPVLQAALARGLHAAGFDAVSTGLISSPGLALLSRLEHFTLGIMLSASHNPATDNGIKIFTSRGEKLSDDEEDEIEALLRANAAPVREGAAPAVDETLEAEYVTHLVEHAGRGLDLGGRTVAVDCANGSASRYAPRVLERLGARVVALHDAPDGNNINAGCGSTHPEDLRREVPRCGAVLGIALDGDADRCILVDERGEVVHGDGILTLLARRAADAGEWADKRVVATVMSNRGLHRALREKGVGVVEVGVGDRQVVEALRREGLPLGGEQSGHIVFGAENHYIGDGLYTALRVLHALQTTGRTLSELAAPYVAFPQVLLNVPVVRKPDLSAVPGVSELVTHVEEELRGDGRVLLRYSGTEPLARVMVEGPDEALIHDQAQRIADRIVAELGA
ncbi:MAG: phosphoglucosamine mutase [Planctomycetes bacterium]|nr:phosphoglucosamine mutase [Planctomycetota bacterium]